MAEQTQVAFPDTVYSRIDWLSVEYKRPDLSDVDSNHPDYQDEIFRKNIEADTANLPLETGSGHGFVNDSGVPVHNNYRRVILSATDSTSLLRILAIAKAGDGSGTMCIYFFRDALVFYSKQNTPVAWIEICLDCGEARFYPRAAYMDCTVESECNKELMKFIEALRVLHDRPLRD